jgi:hypothetical protein
MSRRHRPHRFPGHPAGGPFGQPASREVAPQVVPGPYTPAGPPGSELRIGDREREAAVAALGEHFAAGRLTQDEFEQRSAAAWDARTASRLAPLFADLPLPHGPLSPPRPPTLAHPPGRTWPPGPGTSRAGGRGRGSRIPWLPVVLLAIGLAVLFDAPWLLFVLLGAVLLLRRGGR